MKTSTRPPRRRPVDVLPGVHGTARVDRRVAALLPRLRPGDIAVLDVLDLDKRTAQALADARVAAVVDASDLISGRYPNLGPELLAQAGVVLVDRIGSAGLAAVKDGTPVRVHKGSLCLGERVVATGRQLDEAAIEAEMAEARRGMLTQLESFTHNSSEFLRREQDLLLHGAGLPPLGTPITGRPVVVVADPRELGIRRKALKPFLREQDPVLVAVNEGADALVDAGWRPHVVVVSALAELPSAKALRSAGDVVVVVEPGAATSAVERLERLGVRPVLLETTANAEDAALLLADAGQPQVIVTVGSRATLEEFLDRGRSGLSSTYLTRLKVGSRLVDASAVPMLYSGKVRPRHVLLALLVCMTVVAAAIASTPVGQGWAEDLWTWLGDAIDGLRGLVS
jgi:uncharacterized membrane-anchored protein